MICSHQRIYLFGPEQSLIELILSANPTQKMTPQKLAHFRAFVHGWSIKFRQNLKRTKKKGNNNFALFIVHTQFRK